MACGGEKKEPRNGRLKIRPEGANPPGINDHFKGAFLLSIPSATSSPYFFSLSFAATFNIDEKLRQDELEAFKQAFDMFDKNSDGTISTKVRMEASPLVQI